MIFTNEIKKELYFNDIRLIEKINWSWEDHYVIYDPIQENENEYSFEKNIFWVKEESDMLRRIVWETYDKYWMNSYSLMWKGYKEPDLVNIIDEHQKEKLEETEELYDEIISYINEKRWKSNA